ncbi:OpgC family protein [Aureimonas psammosilenae]|uniref:OpgC family protein n=1 Tax=Aureimonas psammosilenae TaxID=2495496 RepID=UPI0012612527|nr:OpgC domain-containing protein [Aureimonas psammosilenae]
MDFFRGIALAMIFVNHVPGNLWENFTTRNFGFSDSAELFVFLAGFASAFAYAKPFLAGHRLLATLKAWRRAGILYLVHATLTLFAIGLFAWGALAFGDGGLLRENNLAALEAAPVDTLMGLATLGHQLKFVNILPMYMVLLLALPALLALCDRFGRGGMMLASFALWVASALFWLNMPNHPADGGWFFNPFSWQLIFAAGLYCGLARSEGGEGLPFSSTLYGAALAFLLFAFLFVEFELWGMDRALGLPVMLAGFDKTYVSVPRLLHLLALVYVFAHAPRSSVLSRVSGDNPFTRLGRHSLPVFATGTALALMAQVVKFEEPPEIMRDTVLIAGGLGLQFALAHFLDWWREAERQLKASAASKANPATARPALAAPRREDKRPAAPALPSGKNAGIVASIMKR